MMKYLKNRYFFIKDLNTTFTVEVVTKKTLIEMINDAIKYKDICDDSIAILYKDNSFFCIDEENIDEVNNFKKTDIISIVWSNTETYVVWGNFEINEAGVVTVNDEEIIDENIIEVSSPDYKEEIEEEVQTQTTNETPEEVVEESPEEVAKKVTDINNVIVRPVNNTIAIIEVDNNEYTVIKSGFNDMFSAVNYHNEIRVFLEKSKCIEELKNKIDRLKDRIEEAEMLPLEYFDGDESCKIYDTIDKMKQRLKTLKKIYKHLIA